MEDLSNGNEKIESEIKNELSSIAREFGEGESEHIEGGGESEDKGPSPFNLSLADLIKRVFPNGFEDAAAYPRKAIFRMATMGLSEDDVSKISALQDADETFIKIKAALLESLVQEYGHIKIDVRLAYVGVEAVDNVPMILQIAEHRKILKDIEAHVKREKGGE
jgi:hypothetical protein